VIITLFLKELYKLKTPEKVMLTKIFDAKEDERH
jgi:hypothetical protein